MNFLSAIIATKQRQVETAKGILSEAQLREQVSRNQSGSSAHALRTVLSTSEKINIIAEFKRRSPSKGLIRSDANAVEIASDYADGGAVAISVLTEENFFDGSLEDLRAIRDTVNLPILRKDFIFDEYQIYEAAVAGADAVLLIVAALDDQSLAHLRRLIEDELKMDALVEVHDQTELRRAIDCGATLIGVNNRDLRTFEVSLETSFKLIEHAASETIFISESGLENSDDLVRLRNAGYRGFLIGESLMRASSPRDALKELLKSDKREGLISR